MADFLPPEMVRTRLEDVVLRIKYLGLGMVAPFLDKVIDRPSKESVDRAIKTLKSLGALKPGEEELTPLGFRLAKMPMNPQIGKMVLMGIIFRCLDPVLTVAAALDLGKDPFNIKVMA
jgi:ATP-dependent RNA helicase DHX36